MMRQFRLILSTFFILGNVIIAKAQQLNLSEVKAELCKGELLTQDYCNDKTSPGNILDIYQDMMSRMLEKSSTHPLSEELGIHIFSYESYVDAVKFWTSPTDTYELPKPDSLKVFQKDAINLISTLFEQDLVSPARKTLILDAIANNKIIHPYFAVEYLAQLTVEDSIIMGSAQKTIENLLLSNVDRRVKMFKKIELNFPADSILASDFIASVKSPIEQIYTEVSLMDDARWERGKNCSICDASLQTNSLVFGWNIGLELPLEISFSTSTSSPKISSYDIVTNKKIAEVLLQIEQNRKSDILYNLVYSPLFARNFICSNLGINTQNHLPTTLPYTVIYYLFEYHLFDNVARIEIPLYKNINFKLTNQIERRWDTGLTSTEKLQMFKNLQKSSWLDIYSSDIHRSIWTSINYSSIKHTFELMSKLKLGDFPESSSSRVMCWITQTYEEKQTLRGILQWLQEVSGGEFKAKDFTNFTVEKDNARVIISEQFEFKGKQFKITRNEHFRTNKSYNMIIEGLTSVWNKENSGGKAFYFVANSKLILFNTEEKVNKLSDAMNWLIIKM